MPCPPPKSPAVAPRSEAFEILLPKIERYLRIAFRGLLAEAREEAVQEGLVNALAAYRRLEAQGKADLAYPSALARYAAAQFRDGRQIAERMNVKDVTSRHCQRRKGVRVERIDSFDRQQNCWRELVVEDRRAGPDRIAAMRIDFAAFLDSLAARERKIALRLAMGESTSGVARQFRLSSARISQLRRELHRKWRMLHGELPALGGAAA